MRDFIRRCWALLVIAAAPAAAQDEIAPWEDPDNPTVLAIEDYLNNLPTIRSHFTQYNADGSVDVGVMWLWRPGRARIEYSPPNDLLLIADGTWLIYFDAALDQVSHIPIATGPFRFLLSEGLSLFEDVRLTALRRSRGLLSLTVEDPEASGAGSVTLVFEEDPLKLRQWRVTDPQGYRTTVRLDNAVLGESFAREWFFFPESARQQEDFRIGAHE